jgi:hypothetical protein
MFINGSGAKPMDAFCDFPKQSPSRVRSTIEFQCDRALFGVSQQLCIFARQLGTCMNRCYFRAPL